MTPSKNSAYAAMAQQLVGECCHAEDSLRSLLKELHTLKLRMALGETVQCDRNGTSKMLAMHYATEASHVKHRMSRVRLTRRKLWAFNKLQRGEK